MTHLPTFCKFQAAKKLMQCTSILRKMSAEAKPTENFAIKPKRRGENWISSPLTLTRIQEIGSVTGITIGLNYVGWMKVSVPELQILDWDLKCIPKDILLEINESNILALAYDIKAALPESDLYVMESLPVREFKCLTGLSKTQLSSMLSVLLNGLKKDAKWKEKVIFQKKFVVNYLFSIIVASERVSTKLVVENILLNAINFVDNSESGDSPSTIHPKINIDYQFIKNFKQMEMEKQENLSLALLLTLSFVEVNILKNEKSVEKVKKRRKCSLFL